MPAGNPGCGIYHLGLDQYNNHDSLQALVTEGIDHSTAVCLVTWPMNATRLEMTCFDTDSLLLPFKCQLVSVSVLDI